MKHKLKITILSILFGLLFGIPVYADSNTYIIDQSDVLGGIYFDAERKSRNNIGRSGTSHYLYDHEHHGGHGNSGGI